MKLLRVLLIPALVGSSIFLYADDAHSPKVNIAASSRLSHQTKLELIRLLNAEFAFAKVPIPMGPKGLTIKASNETVEPQGPDLRMLLANAGVTARPGDRLQITNVEFTDHDMLIDINGGPKKAPKWYQRIQVGGNGGMTPVTNGPDNRNAHGSTLKIEFDGYVPELNMEQVKQLLAPVLDFTVKSATEAFADAMPPNVRKAIHEHRVLVGMNREMVEYAKGRPEQRIREKDGDTEYEEWIYGQPPQEVDFVRFVGDEVVQDKLMTVDGQKIIRTKREVQPFDSLTGQPVAVAQKDEPKKNTSDVTLIQTKGPTLRRPGEAPPAAEDTSGGYQKPVPPTLDTGDPNSAPGAPEEGPQQTVPH